MSAFVQLPQGERSFEADENFRAERKAQAASVSHQHREMRAALTSLYHRTEKLQKLLQLAKASSDVPHALAAYRYVHQLTPPFHLLLSLCCSLFLLVLVLVLVLLLLLLLLLLMLLMLLLLLAHLTRVFRTQVCPSRPLAQKPHRLTPRHPVTEIRFEHLCWIFILDSGLGWA